jgi:hypothetical protein
MTVDFLLQVCASAFALAGTFLLRKPSRVAPWGFVCWLVSNPAAMAFMAINGHWWFFLQHAVFFFLAIDGVWNWLILPRLSNEQRLTDLR